MTTAPNQVRALLRLRWQMVRVPGVRLAIALAGVLVLYLLEAAVTSTSRLSVPALATAVRLGPTAFLGFGVLAVVAPLTAGGGNEIFPPDQLVAYPVRPSTQFLGGLILAPVNLVWVLQLVVLAAETAYLCAGLPPGGSPLLGGVTTAMFVAALTVLGQAVAWLVVGLRQTVGGRRTVQVTALLVLAVGFFVVRTGSGPAFLDASPTHTVVRGVIAGGSGDLGRWAATTAGLLALLLTALLAGSRVCGWALRRPGDATVVGESRQVRRRRPGKSALHELVTVDRASVWRAPALRRGGLVLAVMPGLISAGGAVPWTSLVILPGLVAAGAGLLFGVNAFCLDASGAVWLASLPHAPGLVARAKVIVLTETVAGAVVVAAVAGSLRSPGLPTPAELSAIVAAAIACTAVVVATGMAMSVRHPHRAELRGPRDAVAPPGALAFASLRLAAPAALVGVVLEGAAQSGAAFLPPLLALPVVGVAWWSLRRSLRRYDDPLCRSRIVQTVSSG